MNQDWRRSRNRWAFQPWKAYSARMHSEVHGITDEISKKNRRSMSLWNGLSLYAKTPTLIVWHNIDFDRQIMFLEVDRVRKKRFTRKKNEKNVCWKQVCVLWRSDWILFQFLHLEAETSFKIDTNLIEIIWRRIWQRTHTYSQILKRRKVFLWAEEIIVYKFIFLTFAYYATTSAPPNRKLSRQLLFAVFNSCVSWR